MKKALLSLLAVALATIAAAQEIGMDKARLAAVNYLAINEPDIKGQIAAKPEHVYKDNAGTPVMYAYNVGEYGFILVGADESFEPVIGYSFNGTFNYERLPENLNGWLNGYVEDVCAVKRSSAKSVEISAFQQRCKAEWKALENGDATFYAAKGAKNVEALIETHWDQGAGYNNYCPEYSNGSGGHACTGCVATAMAQIIRYYCYPNTGFFHQSYTHSTYGNLRVDFDSAYYDYSKMPESVGYYSPADQQHAVSLLCYHCGVAVKMNYQNPSHTSGSGAHSEDVPKALKFFGYTKSFHLTKNSFPSATWDSLLRHDLDLGRPIYYSGSNSDGGHAFVCDGYKTNNGRYHFNFGWSGYGDGFYSLTSVNGYATGQAAVFNIIPSRIGPMQDILYIAADGQGDGSAWNSATPNLDDALALCGLYKKGTLWIKNGTYYGDNTQNDASFTLSNGVTLYGGFAGTESTLDERNLQAGATVLSGGGKRIALYSPSATNDSRINDITFADGLAANGAGAYISNTVRLERCIFENNTDTSADGAALYCNASNVYCCIFRNNHGGAAYLSDSPLKNSLIVHNDGFGIHSEGGTVDGCDIVCNTGVGIINNSNTKIRNSVIWRNDSSLTSNNISRITFSAIEGFGDIDSNSNFGISRINRPTEGKGPFFMDPDTTCGPSPTMGDWQISSLSPLVNAGDTNRNGSYKHDLAGGNRFRSGRVDIGCYEQDPYVGIETPVETQVLHIYPNPANNVLGIDGVSGSVEIYDAMGRRVLTAKTTSDHTLIDISTLPRGLYLLRIDGTSAKFIKN